MRPATAAPSTSTEPLTCLSLLGLVGEIVSRFERRGYKLVAMKLVAPGVKHLEEHYADLKEKSFFPGLIKYMSSGTSFAERAPAGARPRRRRIARP